MIFAELQRSERWIWAVIVVSLLILPLAVRAIFGGARAWRTGRDHPFGTFALMLGLGIVAEGLDGAGGLRDLRTELGLAFAVLGLPWIEQFEGWLRRSLGRERR